MEQLNRGFSTLEMMIAMAVMVIALSAVVLVSFSNQNMLIGSETNAEAMNRAQDLLEQAQQYARKDFRLVNATSSTDDIYTKVVSVQPWANDPYSSKLVTARVSWKGPHQEDRSLSLTTVLSNFTNAVGGDTCAAPTGNWTAPISTDYQMTNSDLLAGAPADTYTVGALDAYRGKLYVGASKTGINSSPTFFIFNIPNPAQKPSVTGGVDNAPTTVDGINALAAGNTAIVSGSAHSYVYAASGHGANFDTCSQGPSCSQMQVFDVTGSVPNLVFSFKFATSSNSSPNWTPYVSGTGSTVGKSIFYKDGYVYLGLSAATGPEFNIIDVHNPLNPTPISGYEVGAGVESIYVRGKFAYLATDDTSKPLIVLDISNPLVPTSVTVSGIPGSIGHGNAVFAIGDTLYLGRTNSGGSAELYSVNIKNPGSGVSAIGSATLGKNIAGIIVRGSYAIVLTGQSTPPSQLLIYDVSNPASIASYGTPLSISGTGTTLDCELNYFYAGSNNGANGFISVIKPS